LTLKGVSDRIAASVLVGDARMAGSAAFAALQGAHGTLLAAIAGGSDDLQAHVDACRTMAAGVEPGLSAFYARIPQRLGDFR
jgi:hypothetical protein